MTVRRTASALSGRVATSTLGAPHDVDVPSCPALLTALGRELDRPEPRPAEIARLVARDLGLVARVLRAANAPVHGLAVEVTTLPPALRLVGHRRLLNVARTHVLATSLAAGARVPSAYWTRSVAVASCAEMVARRLRGVSPDEAYLGGLFHDAGALVLAERHPDYWDLHAAAREGGRDPRALETERYGIHHGAVGARVARAWGFGAVVADSVDAHHERDLGVRCGPEGTALAAVVQLAIALVERCEAARADGAVYPHFALEGSSLARCARLLDVGDGLVAEVESTLAGERPRDTAA